MKRYSGIWEEVISFRNLCYSAHKASSGKWDRASVSDFMFDMESLLLTIEDDLINGTYTPGQYSVFHVNEPKRRKISAAPFRDRVVHQAVCRAMEPFLERIYQPCSYACRKGKGMHKALNLAGSLIRKNTHFLKCDIRKCFDSVDHEILKSILMRKFKEEKLLNLLFKIINSPVPGAVDGKGLAIGNLTSQHFANMYLTKLDLFVLSQLKPEGYVRYMDDFVLFSSDDYFLEKSKIAIEEFLNENLRMLLKMPGSFVGRADDGLPFLGMRLFRGTTRVDRKALVKATRKVRQNNLRYYQRQNKADYENDDLVQSTSSICAHLAHADTLEFRRKLLKDAVQYGL